MVALKVSILVEGALSNLEVVRLSTQGEAHLSNQEGEAQSILEVDLRSYQRVAQQVARKLQRVVELHLY